jgi:hypothetical protein
VYAAEMASCGMICIPSFMKIGIGIQAVISFSLRNFREAVMFVLLKKGIYESRH